MENNARNCETKQQPAEESLIDYDMDWESPRYAAVGRMTIDIAGSGTALIDYDAS